MTTHRTVADQLREAAQQVPRMFWGRSNTTVHIPETEDWAGKDLCITGLSRPVGKAYARHIAAASPANVLSLLDQRDDLMTALEALLDMDVAYQRGPRVQEAVAVARVAIAKAKGEQPKLNAGLPRAAFPHMSPAEYLAQRLREDDEDLQDLMDRDMGG